MSRQPTAQEWWASEVGSTALPPGPGEWVYFIKERHGSAIKIGYASNVVNRLKGLLTSSSHDLYVAFWTAGNTHLERCLHEVFSGFRLRGEWFRAGTALLDVAAGLHTHTTLDWDHVTQEVCAQIGSRKTMMKIIGKYRARDTEAAGGCVTGPPPELPTRDSSERRPEALGLPS